MEQTLKIPEFKTERDEAQWWVENQDQLAPQFERAAAEGKLGRGTVALRGNTPTTTIRLDPEDIAKARFHAERKGLKYQTYLKMLIRQALHEEDVQAGPSVQHGGKKRSTVPKHPGLHGHSPDGDGEIRNKRSDTLVGTLRDEYGKDFAKGYRSDAKLGTVLEREGLGDLRQLLEKSSSKRYRERQSKVLRSRTKVSSVE
jgi:predicted DNA binding CopG/RHH family protein